MADKLNLTAQDFQYVLGKAKVVKKGFGKAYLQLEITEKELEKYQRSVKNIISGS